ncbi:MAG: DUF996 domain-containing protein [Aigarchaeota archaeon]|nr:DUF996 domain-containing protein [Aigarchaeota archaeon]MDW8092482.1 DUF996 domain-containing protein [Nitrososphaerota archaeon]
MTFDSAKYVAGVGSLLMVLSIVPVVGPSLMIGGLIVLLIGIHQLSHALNNPGIFKNILIWALLMTVGVVTVIITGLTALVATLSLEFLAFAEFIATMISILVLLWVIAIVGSVFLRRGYNQIALSTGANMFNVVGLLFLIGSVLLITFVGFLIIWVAFLIQTIAFFSLEQRGITAQSSPQV